MFSRINIKEQLTTYRDNRINEEALMKEVSRIFSEQDKDRQEIKDRLFQKRAPSENSFEFDLLNTHRIYHKCDIEKICNVYRLRFLDSQYFKGDFPPCAISEIHRLEKEHQNELKGFKIMAPAKLLKLENADDPLLFAPMGNGYYYLIHKWGRDLHPLRKLAMWPLRSMENLVITVILFSALLTAAAPMHWFTTDPGVGNYIFLFLFTLKAVGGLVLLYGVSKGKNFNGAIWESKYYNG